MGLDGQDRRRTPGAVRRAGRVRRRRPVLVPGRGRPENGHRPGRLGRVRPAGGLPWELQAMARSRARPAGRLRGVVAEQHRSGDERQAGVLRAVRRRGVLRDRPVPADRARVRAPRPLVLTRAIVFARTRYAIRTGRRRPQDVRPGRPGVPDPRERVGEILEELRRTEGAFEQERERAIAEERRADAERHPGRRGTAGAERVARGEAPRTRRRPRWVLLESGWLVLLGGAPRGVVGSPAKSGADLDPVNLWYPCRRVRATRPRTTTTRVWEADADPDRARLDQGRQGVTIRRTRSEPAQFRPGLTAAVLAAPSGTTPRARSPMHPDQLAVDDPQAVQCHPHRPIPGCCLRGPGGARSESAEHVQTCRDLGDPTALPMKSLETAACSTLARPIHQGDEVDAGQPGPAG